MTLSGILLITVYSFVYPIINQKMLVTHPDFHARHCFLFLEFKANHPKARLYYAFFLTRRLCFAFVLVCMKDFIRYQCMLIVLMNGMTLWYHICVRPFHSVLQNFLGLFNEAILTVFSIMLFFFLSPNNPEMLEMESFICIGIIIFFFVLNWIIVIPVMISKVVCSIREKCRKLTQLEKEELEEAKVVRHVHIEDPNRDSARYSTL